jgi:antirestriction protein
VVKYFRLYKWGRVVPKGQKVARCEEVLWSDWEGFPSGLWTESGPSVSDFWCEYSSLESLSSDEIEAFCIWWSHTSPTQLLNAVENFRESYQGEFSKLQDFAHKIVDSDGSLESENGVLVRYFDYESYAKDLLYSGDYFEVEGFYFRS